MIKEDKIKTEYFEYEKIAAEADMKIANAIEEHNTLTKDYVFDAEKSIKWNRNEVACRRKALENIVSEQQELKKNAIKKVDNIIKEYLEQFKEVNEENWSKISSTCIRMGKISSTLQIHFICQISKDFLLIAKGMRG